MRTDRTRIAPLLLPHFPTMEKATSDEWHGFLNAMTGLDIDLAEPNSTAFDKWREALAEQKGLPVWGYTDAQIAAMKARGEELKRMEEERQQREAETLNLLAIAAPTKTAEQLIADAKAAA
jgi:hypothetical protein